MPNRIYAPFTVDHLAVRWSTRDVMHLGPATVYREGNLLRIRLEQRMPPTKVVSEFRDAIEDASDCRKPFVMVMFSVDGDPDVKALATRAAGHKIHLGIWGSDIWRGLPPRPLLA